MSKGAEIEKFTEDYIFQSSRPSHPRRRKHYHGFKKRSDKEEIMEMSSGSLLRHYARQALIFIGILALTIVLFKFVESLVTDNPLPPRLFPDYFS
ncbi:MAG: hypothetical protein LPK46_02750 [Bacteroidota bacterium]|nr:hypothetical protein [Bacteroidota bacterium]MDX5427062.1 hypothetical protein [Bacteroidota bacterium]MDX5505039.1 hypothetical protein [Bacteroidota bacterium]